MKLQLSNYRATTCHVNLLTKIYLIEDPCIPAGMQALLFAKLIKNPHDFLFCFKFLLNLPLLYSHLLQSKNEQTLLYIGVKPCAKGSIYVALEWGYLYLTFFNISNNLFDFLTSNNLGVESEAGFGM